jgi:hypothetical protein
VYDWVAWIACNPGGRSPQEETTVRSRRRSMSPNLPAAAALVELCSTRIASDPGHPNVSPAAFRERLLNSSAHEKTADRPDDPPLEFL